MKTLNELQLNYLNDYIANISISEAEINRIRQEHIHLLNCKHQTNRVPVVVNLIRINPTKKKCWIENDGLGVQFWPEEMLKSKFQINDCVSVSILINEL